MVCASVSADVNDVLAISTMWSESVSDENPLVLSPNGVHGISARNSPGHGLPAVPFSRLWHPAYLWRNSPMHAINPVEDRE